jgi:hypothetical protein
LTLAFLLELTKDYKIIGDCKCNHFRILLFILTLILLTDQILSTLEYWTMLHNFKWPPNLTTTFGHAYKNPNYQGTTFDNFALACANGHLNVKNRIF